MPGANSKQSAVIMAYWPSTQWNLTINYSTMQLGIVQYFVWHKICVKSKDKTVAEYHLFAYVKWKDLHRKFDWFGTAATVCESTSESCSNFLLVQRIARRCAYVSMPVNFGDLIENVFITCPIFKYCM